MFIFSKIYVICIFLLYDCWTSVPLPLFYLHPSSVSSTIPHYHTLTLYQNSVMPRLLCKLSLRTAALSHPLIEFSELILLPKPLLMRTSLVNTLPNTQTHLNIFQEFTIHNNYTTRCFVSPFQIP